MPGRIVGEPPLQEGNVRDIIVDYRTLAKEFLDRLGWDARTTVPSEKSLNELGMQFPASEMGK
jgi:aldehyde:ferredoxin oxidoreductase